MDYATHCDILVYNTPEEIENEGFTQKTHQIFSRPHDYGDSIVFEKLRFRDELVWRVGLIVTISRVFKFRLGSVDVI